MSSIHGLRKTEANNKDGVDSGRITDDIISWEQSGGRIPRNKVGKAEI